jgi:Sec-independent protein translocase protein TatA
LDLLIKHESQSIPDGGLGFDEPQKLPELARSIGLAKIEFEKAAKERSSATTTSSPTTGADTEPLIVAAKNLGISTERALWQDNATAPTAMIVEGVRIHACL